MGMDVIVEIVDSHVTDEIFEKIFSFFRAVDERFSPFKPESELSRMNQGKISVDDCSEDMKEVLRLSEDTKRISKGYFDIMKPDGVCDTCGMVKGWAIWKASCILTDAGFRNFYVEAGGDIQTSGTDSSGQKWSIGIRNPFKPESEIVKVLSLSGEGIATSGSYAKGAHIYDPHKKEYVDGNIVSFTVVGPNVYEADRFATAGFAMQEKGVEFIESLSGLEAYSINSGGIATMTSGFEKYVKIF